MKNRTSWCGSGLGGFEKRAAEFLARGDGTIPSRPGSERGWWKDLQAGIRDFRIGETEPATVWTDVGWAFDETAALDGTFGFRRDLDLL